jgi:hypothetical protein
VFSFCLVVETMAKGGIIFRCTLVLCCGLLFLNSLSQNNGRNSVGDKKVPKIGTGGGEGDHEHNLRLVQPEETMMP